MFHHGSQVLGTVALGQQWSNEGGGGGGGGSHMEGTSTLLSA